MALNLVGALILLALSTGLNLLLRPRIKRAKSPNLEVTRADEGIPTCLGYGRYVVAPNVVRWGDSGQVPSPVGSTYYYCTLTGVLSYGPISAILDIQSGGKSLRFEPVTAAQGAPAGQEQVILPSLPYTFTDPDTPVVFDIDAAQMFGGREQEGGVRGELRIYPGGLAQAADQLTTAYMTAAGLSGGTGRPGVCYAAFGRVPTSAVDKFYFGTVPQIKDFTFILKFSPTALGVGMLGDDANPAEIIYDLLTNNLRGLGLATSLIDTDNFVSVAETLSDEGLGLSCCFSTQDEVEDMIDSILQHIHGVMRISPLTGKYQLKLARNDYVASTLPRITTSLKGASYGNARNIKLSRPNYRETTNDIQITYRRFSTSDIGPTTKTLTANLDYPDDQIVFLDTHAQNISALVLYDDDVQITTGYTYFPDTGIVVLGTASGAAEGSVITASFIAGPVFNGYKEATARWQDLASIQQSGELRTFTADYPFLTTDLNAGTLIGRLGQQMSRSLWNAQWEMDRSGYGLAPGDVVRVHHFPMDQDGMEYEILDDVPFRVTEVDYGLLEEGTITVTAIEDVFAQDIAPILPQSSGGTGLATTAAPSMSISYAATSAIRVNLYPSDPNFQIELWRASVEPGVGQTSGADLVTTLPGTTTSYDDTFPVAGRGVQHTGRPFPVMDRRSVFYGGTQRYTSQRGRLTRLLNPSSASMPPGDSVVIGGSYWYAARLVPGPSQRGFSAGELTPWQLMTATAGTPGGRVCTIPTVTYASVDDGTQGTLTLTIVDDQHRVTLVEFQTQSGTGPMGEWADTTQVAASRSLATAGRSVPVTRWGSRFYNGSLPRSATSRSVGSTLTASRIVTPVGLTAVPYVATVNTTPSSPSTINYRITYLDCSGASVSNLTGTVAFP